MATQIQLRRGTTAEWAASDIILAEGELGMDLDLHIFKIGNGGDPWSTLPVSSGVNGDTGAPGASGAQVTFVSDS